MSNRTHADDAARWFLRLQDESTNTQVFLEWQRWMNAAPAHRTAYEEIEETIFRLEIPVTPQLPSAEELAADDYDGSVPVEEWPTRNPRHAVVTPRAATRRYAMAAGIAAMGLLAGGLWFSGTYRAQHGTYAYSTSHGERREIELPEGSRITLDADSALNVELTPERRILTLTRGEGYFKVAKDARRPFTVQAGNAQVRALGTAFNIRRSENRTVVAVTEGRVEVTVSPKPAPTQDSANSPRAEVSSRKDTQSPPFAMQLAAGEAVSYMGEGTTSILAPAEASLATSWLNGRRQYRNEPLRYVLADIDRYSRRRIRIADEATGNLQFTGTIKLDSSDAWLKGLAIALPVTITEAPDGELFVARKPR